MEPNHVIEILTATLDPVHQEAAGKKLDEVTTYFHTTNDDDDASDHHQRIYEIQQRQLTSSQPNQATTEHNIFTMIIPFMIINITTILNK